MLFLHFPQWLRSFCNIYNNYYCYVAWKGPRDVLHCLTAMAQAPLEKPSINLRSHHNPSLISLQEALILQVFSVCNWYFSHKHCRPWNHVGKRLLPPIFIPNSVHNQSASRIIALTYLTKNVSNESAFLVQMGHPYRAFLRNQIRTNFRVPSSLTMPRNPTAPTALTVPRVPTLPAVPTAPTAPTSTAFTPSG